MENKKYNTVNVNGARISGAEVVKTFEADINRFKLNSLGVISYVYIMDLDTTYFWLSVDSEKDDDSLPLILNVKGIVSKKTIKHLLKSYLLENDKRITEKLSNFKSQELDSSRVKEKTIIELVNYQGNLIVTFFDSWYDIAIMSLEVDTIQGYSKHDVMNTFVYGGNDFGDDKLIELIGFIDYHLELEQFRYINRIC
jgi:hypothetical protein